MKEGIFLMNLKQCIRLHHVGTTSPQIELLIAANNAGKPFSGLTFQLKYELIDMKTHLGLLAVGKLNVKFINH